jgi:integrase
MMADDRSPSSRAVVPAGPRVLSGSRGRAGSVRSVTKRWQPPEGLAPDDVTAVIEAAATERDRLLLRALWASGGRVSEVLALRPKDVQRDHLVMPNRKNPGMPVKRVFVPAGQADLPGDLLVWAREQGLAADEPLFFSRKRGPSGERRAISRQQAWEVVKAASERADVRVLALRASGAGAAGEPAPIHPHLLRHARVRQIVRSTKSLPIAQRQAGWSRLQMAYLTVGDEEVRRAMRTVEE